MKTLPNLFIVGSPKCGTTSLVDSLGQLSNVFVPTIKEPNHFLGSSSSDLALCITEESSYNALYANSNKYKYRIDASTSYFIDNNSPQKIKTYNPKAKIIILIREPLARAISHFKMEKYTYRREDNDINNCLRESYKRDYFGMNVNPYLENSLYNKHIIKWQKVFGDSLFVGAIEDENLNRKISKFLEIESFEMEMKNTAKTFRFSVFSKITRSFIADRLRYQLGRRSKSVIKDLIYKNIKRQNEELAKETEEKLELSLYKEVPLLREVFKINIDSWKKQ